MARVFVSHSGKDAATASGVHRWLVDDGHEVFLDHDLHDGIVVGDEWEQRLHERLRWADAVVCVLTSSYLASMWCTAEVGIARSRGSRLLPVRAEPGVSHPLLTSVQHLDLTMDATAARARLAEVLQRIDAVGGAGWPDGRSPFPGLRSFDTDQHRVFFGRAREVDQLAELLRSPAERAEGAVLLIVGPSGCGKSSLVRAGLLPAMAAEPQWWTVPAILPGTDPVAALTRELAATAQRIGLDWTVSGVRRRLDDGGLTKLADDLLLAVSGHRRRRLLVVVDQLEELITRTPSAERARFAQLLRPALGGPVQVVATLRPEFLDRLLIDSDLALLPTHAYTLRPLRREALRSVIEGPARLAGIGVDDDLTARLVADTDSGEALPLLAYTLAALADGLERGGRLLSTRYQQLGGVQGALTQQADAALAAAAAAGGRHRAQVIKELLRLVTVDEQGRPARWRVQREELPDPVAAEFDAFVARRLLTTDSENGRVVVGVAHEAFLSAWSPLAEAIAGAASALRARRQVEQAAAAWTEDGRPSTKLWERGQLAAALADTGARVQTGGRSRGATTAGAASASTRRHVGPYWSAKRRGLTTDRVDLTPAAHAFLLAGIRRDRTRRRRATTILSVLLTLALIAAGIAITQQQVATEKERIATARQLAATAVANLGTHLDLAQLLAVEAYRMYPDAQTRAALFQAVTTSPRLVRYLDAGAQVITVSGSSDGNSVVAGTADGRLVRWDLTTGTRDVMRIGDAPITSVTTDALGGRVAGADGATAVLWDTATGRQSVVHTGQSALVAVSPSGRHLGVVDRAWDEKSDNQPENSGDLTLYDADSGINLGRAPLDSVWDKLGLPDDQTVTLISQGGGWERRRAPDLQTILLSPDSLIDNGASVSNATNDGLYYGNLVDGLGKAWRVAGSPRSSDPDKPDLQATTGVRAQQEQAEALTVSPNGQLMAVADAGTVYVVTTDAVDQEEARSEQLTGNDDINSDGLTFAGDRRLVSASGELLALWDLASLGRVGADLGVELESTCHACETELIPSPDSKRVAVVNEGQSTTTYMLNGAADPRKLTDPGLPMDDSSPDSEKLPTWTSDGKRLVLLGLGDDTAVARGTNGDTRQTIGEQSSAEPATYPVTSRVSSDGARVVVVGAHGDIVIRNFTDGKIERTLPGGVDLDSINSATINLDLTTAALAEQEVLTLVDIETGTRRALPGGPAHGVLFTQKQLLVLRPTGALEVWDTDGAQLLTSLPGGDYQRGLAASPQGHIAARLRSDSLVVLTELDTGAVLGALQQPPLYTNYGGNTVMSFTPDGAQLLVATSGGRLTRWDMTETAWLRGACNGAGRNISAEEWLRYVGTEPPTDLRCDR